MVDQQSPQLSAQCPAARSVDRCCKFYYGDCIFYPSISSVVREAATRGYFTQAESGGGMGESEQPRMDDSPFTRVSGDRVSDGRVDFRTVPEPVGLDDHSPRVDESRWDREEDGRKIDTSVRFLTFGEIYDRFERFIVASDRGAPILLLKAEYEQVANSMIRHGAKTRIAGFRMLYGRKLQITHDVTEVSR